MKLMADIKTDLSGIEMPIGLKDSLADVPQPMQMPVVASLLPLMGAYADGVRARYADGRMHPMALMSVIVGPMASGKSLCARAVDAWLETMREEDKEQRLTEDEWRKRNRSRKASEKALPDPKVVVKEVPVTISCSTLLRRLQRAQGHTLYSFDEELDTLRKTNTAGTWSAKYDIYRKAFDHGRWGQDYNSDQSTSGFADVAYNWTMLGTYGSFRRCFEGESVETGLASKLIVAEMPDNGFAKLVALPDYSPEQQANINEAVAILRSAKGDLELPWLTDAMAEWVEAKRIEAVDDNDLLKDVFRKRAAVIGFRAGVVYHLLERSSSTSLNQGEGAEPPSDASIRFAQTIAQYVLDEQMHLFGVQFLEAAVETERCAYGTGNEDLYDSLPHVFNIKDMKRLKGIAAKPKTLYKIVERWKNNDMVERHDAHSWRKI